jgi:glutamate synthase (NADPH/NADH) large chain
MAEMGFTTIAEMIGRVDRIDMKKAIDHWKADGVDLSRLLHQVPLPAGTPLHQQIEQDHGLAAALDNELIAAAMPALESGETVVLERKIRNVNRTVGAMLSARSPASTATAGSSPTS